MVLTILEVSSMEAACSDAPSANSWLAEETWRAADPTCAQDSVRF
jgi:hypothetical protein